MYICREEGRGGAREGGYERSSFTSGYQPFPLQLLVLPRNGQIFLKFLSLNAVLPIFSVSFF